MSLLSNLRKAGFKTYWALEKRIAPGLVYSQYRYHQALHSLVPKGCRWADLGCGHQMFAEWMDPEEQELASRASLLVGVDLDFEGLRKNHFAHLRIMANLEQLPIPTGGFDLVTANMVMEHVENPGPVLAEVRRVLAPGGLFIFHTPNRFNPLIRIASVTPKAIKNRLVGILEGRKEEDIFRTFYRANCSEDIHALANASGFEVRKIAAIRSSALTASLGPISVPELIFLRILERDNLAHLRHCIICVLQKPVQGNEEHRALDFAGLPSLEISA